MSIRVILASQSKGRSDMLHGAGLSFENRPADLDEATITQAMLAQGAAPDAIALKLAQEKALAISEAHRDALVIGSDQVVDFV